MDSEYKTAACPAYEALLEDYLSGELDSGRARDVAEHLKECAGCRVALEDASTSVLLMQAAGTWLERAPDPAPGFAHQVMARIRLELENPEKSLWQSFISLGWRFAATATLALAIMATYDATWQHSTAQNPAVDSDSQVQGIFSPSPGNVPASRDEVLLMVAESNDGNH